MLTYKEFVIWCNRRASGGCWGMTTAIICLDVLAQMRKTPFWKRKKRWQEEFNHDDNLYKEIVKPTNDKIENFFSEEGV